MSSDLAISVQGLGKCYRIYDTPRHRLLQMLLRQPYGREFWALRDVSFTLKRGETLGIVGRNGAGKSTLLQLVCGTLAPSCGTLQVQGRVAALLELGAGFNPEFTGRENLYLNASVLGLSPEEINARYDGIVSFSGIGDFIHQPVKTYSSGMYVRLAFAIATSVDPDILIIDEALSVGDGEFARKSFDRIMALKERGATILFCSHSMYQVEAFCERALWLEGGQIRMLDVAQKVTASYQATLDRMETDATAPVTAAVSSAPPGQARILEVIATADGVTGTVLNLVSRRSDLEIMVRFTVDPTLPPPAVLLGFATANGITISSLSSADDGIQMQVDAHGNGRATAVFPQIPLLKGEYTVTCIVACEQGIHPYDIRERSVLLHVAQAGPLQGFVALPHRWQVADAP